MARRTGEDLLTDGNVARRAQTHRPDDRQPGEDEAIQTRLPKWEVCHTRANLPQMPPLEEEDTDPVPAPMVERRKLSTSERVHRGINWASLVGVIGTALVGYFADANRGKTDDAMVTGAATEIAALKEWKQAATRDLQTQAEQIAMLRESVAALRVRAGAHRTADTLDLLLPAPQLQAPAAGAAAPEKIEEIKKAMAPKAP